MEENSQSPEEQKELTPEELNEVAVGGIYIAPNGAGGSTDKPDGWIEINSFQWGGE